MEIGGTAEAEQADPEAQQPVQRGRDASAPSEVPAA